MKNYVQLLVLTLCIFLSIGSAAAQNPKTNVDGFWGIKFGASIAESRRIIAQNGGKIDEGKSDKEILVITEPRLQYDFLHLLQEKYSWRNGVNKISLKFVGDKFFQAETLLSGSDSDDTLGLFFGITEEFDERYYKTSEGKMDDGRGYSYWKFKQPQGYENTIVMLVNAQNEGVLLNFIDGKLGAEVVQLKKNRATIESYYESASAYLKAGKHDLAIADYTKIIDLEPQAVEAYRHRGRSYAMQDRYDLAVVDFTSGLRVSPDDAELLLFRATTYNMQKAVDLALADLHRAIQLNPSEPRAYMMRGMIFCHQDKKALAIADNEKLVSLGGKVTNRCQ